MTINELIETLQTIRNEHGNLEVRMLDTYLENEGWGEDNPLVECGAMYRPAMDGDPEMVLIS